MKHPWLAAFFLMASFSRTSTARADELDAVKKCRDGSDAMACVSAAGLYEFSDPDKAADLLVRGCSISAVPCAMVVYYADRFLATGEGEAPTAAGDRALGLLKRFCALGHGCTKLGDYYQYGELGVLPDLPKALDAYSKACELEGDCWDSASMYEEGRGAHASPAIARPMRAKVTAMWNKGSADQKLAAARDSAAKQLDLAENTTKCKAGSADACNDAALALRGSDPPQAQAMYTTACALSPSSCRFGDYGSFLVATVDIAHGLPWLDRACSLTGVTEPVSVGNPQWACSALAAYFSDGILPRNLKKAAVYWQKTCDVNAEKCRLIAAAYREGRGVPRDATRAQQLVAKADTAERERMRPQIEQGKKSAEQRLASMTTQQAERAAEASPLGNELARLEASIARSEATDTSSARLAWLTGKGPQPPANPIRAEDAAAVARVIDLASQLGLQPLPLGTAPDTAAASAPAQGATPAPSDGAVAPPGAFDRAATAAALGAVNVASCKKPGGPSGGGHVRITFGVNGSADSVAVDQPPFAGTEVGSCVETLFRSVRIPAFSGAPVTIGKTFQIE
jgi:TPR repeat protein